MIVSWKKKRGKWVPNLILYFVQIFQSMILLKAYCTTCSFFLPLYRKQCLIGDQWSPMIFLLLMLIECLFDEIIHLSVTMQGGLIPPGWTSVIQALDQISSLSLKASMVIHRFERLFVVTPCILSEQGYFGQSATWHETHENSILTFR